MTTYVLPMIIKPAACRCLINTLRKRFTPEEDEILLRLVENRQVRNWEQVAAHLPGRTARQCRDRYNSALSKDVIHRPWTQEEDDIIIEKCRQLGPKWVAISSFLKNRSGNDIKNRWHKYIKNNPKYNLEDLKANFKTSRREPKPKEPKPPGGGLDNEFTLNFTSGDEDPFDVIYHDFQSNFELPSPLFLEQSDDFSFSFANL